MLNKSDTKSKTKSRVERISPDGKWRSFPKVPNLLQYVSTGLYFARVKVDGKLIRRSLKAATFEEAKLALHDFVKKHHEPETGFGTFGHALKKYLRALNATHDLSEQSKRYRRYCVKALLASWPGIRLIPVRKITEEACREWAGRFAAEKDEQYFNNTLSALRTILELGGISKDGNPAQKIKRLGVKQTELHLPEPEQFNKILEFVETSGAGQAQHCADLIRFLAFSGCRLSEARKVTWADVDLARGELRVWNAKRSKRSNASVTRQVPVIPPMRELLTRLKASEPAASSRVCVLGECEKSLTRACKLAKTFRLTHHDLRHLFATRCIESGVDVPTVSRWLGHSDGGALAMKTYGHLRREHSLDWVVDEVSTVVERGIEERKEVAFQSFDEADEPIKRGGRKTQVTITRPLTDFEELRLLIASVRAAVVDANATQEKALLGLRTEGVENPQIAFRPDIPEGFADKGYSVSDARRGHAFDLSLTDVEAQKQRIVRLKAALEQLEGMIHAD